jgi:hypothetical protein
MTLQGVTLISESPDTISLGTDEYFTQGTVNLGPGSSLPWPGGDVLWALSFIDASLIVMQGTYNFYNPVITTIDNTGVIVEGTYPSILGNVGINTPPVGPDVQTVVIDIVPVLNGVLTGPVTVTAEGSFPLTFNSYQYYNAWPYLQLETYNPTPSYRIIVPVIGPDITLNDINSLFIVIPSTTDWTIRIIGDTQAYKESRFYNGPNTTAYKGTTVAGAYVLATGPCRLLQIQCNVTGAGASNGGITHDEAGVGAQYLTNLVTVGAGSLTDSMTFPDYGLKIPLGDFVSLYNVNGTTVNGSATTAYP